MQMTQCIGAKPCYIIDMPRAMKKDHLWELYAGIECIKNGYSYDKRYSFKSEYFDRPQIIVFTNTFPEVSAMSADRWKVYRLVVPNGDKELTRLSLIPTEKIHSCHAINQTVVAYKLQQKRKRISLDKEIANDLICEDDKWIEMMDANRDEFDAEVERRVKFRIDNNHG